MLNQQTLHIALLTWGSIFSMIAALCMFLSRNFGKQKRKWMISMLVACAVLLAADALAYAYRGNPERVGYWFVRISNFTVFLLSDVILFLFHGYVCSCLFGGFFKRRDDAEKTLPKIRIRAVFFFAVIGMILVIISQFTGLYYTIDEGNFYKRSDFFFLSLLLPMIGMLIDFSLIVQYRKNVGKKLFVALLFYLFLPLVAECVQIFYYGFLLINISICVAIIILFAMSITEQDKEIAIKERETNELKDSLKSAIDARESCYSAVAQIYLSMHLVNVKTGGYQTIKSSEKIDKNKDSTTDDTFPVQIKIIIDKLVTDQYKKSVLDFSDITTLPERLSGKNVIEHIFLSATAGWCRESFILVDSDQDGQLRQVLFCIEVIDEEKRRENYLQYLAETDMMTGLTNRGTGEKRVKELLERNTGGLFCLFDCDKFKAVNDAYGHAVGDKVIVNVAKCLKATCEEKDVVFRLGGDEFAAYIPGLSEEAQADGFIEKFFENVQKIKLPELGGERIYISMGAAFFRGGKISFDRLYRQADMAMYESKKVTGYKATIYRQTP